MNPMWATCLSSLTPLPTFCLIAIPVEKYALIYAGAQKNMGPSGVTLVIVRDDLLARIPDGLAYHARLPHPRREQVAL